MKKHILSCLLTAALCSTLLIGFTACTDTEDSTGASILQLKVDYLTYQVQGMYLDSLYEYTELTDTFPLLISYQSPGDFGGISIAHEPTNTLLFSGSIIWMGCGVISYPNSYTPAENFPVTNFPIRQPSATRFQSITTTNQSTNLPDSIVNKIWTSISKYKIVRSYYSANTHKIGVYLYTPSVGVGDPHDWRWIIFLYK